MPQDINSVAVVGGGLMGAGIAEVCARAGVDVTVVEADAATAERSHERIEKSLDRAVRSGKLESAERAGLRCVGLRSGGYSEAELVDAAAALVVDVPEDLIDRDWEKYLSPVVTRRRG